MYCPNCKYEYRDGILVCPECGNELCEEEPHNISDYTEASPDETACRLCTAADEFEADIIIAKLRAEGIYAFKKFKSTDSYNRILLGRTILGVDIIVGSGSLDEARDIIQR